MRRSNALRTPRVTMFDDLQHGRPRVRNDEEEVTLYALRTPRVSMFDESPAWLSEFEFSYVTKRRKMFTRTLECKNSDGSLAGEDLNFE